MQVTGQDGTPEIHDLQSIGMQEYIFQGTGEGQQPQGGILVLPFLPMDGLIGKKTAEADIVQAADRAIDTIVTDIHPHGDQGFGVLRRTGVELRQDVHRFIDLIRIQLLLQCGSQQGRRIFILDILRFDTEEKGVGRDIREKPPRKEEGMTPDLQPGLLKIQDLAARIEGNGKMTRDQTILYETSFVRPKHKIPHQYIDVHSKTQLPSFFVHGTIELADVKVEDLIFVLPLYHQPDVGQRAIGRPYVLVLSSLLLVAQTSGITVAGGVGIKINAAMLEVDLAQLQPPVQQAPRDIKTQVNLFGFQQVMMMPFPKAVPQRDLGYV